MSEKTMAEMSAAIQKIYPTAYLSYKNEVWISGVMSPTGTRKIGNSWADAYAKLLASKPQDAPHQGKETERSRMQEWTKEEKAAALELVHQRRRDEAPRAAFAIYRDFAVEKQCEVTALRAMVERLVSSAHPNERDHPKMFPAWEDARALLARIPQ